MLPEPLHPALVHFPIALAAILPIVAIVSLVLIQRRRSPTRSWIWVVIAAALLFGSAWIAARTGEAQEERVEEIVPESALHEHEEAAELFLILSGVSVLLFAAGLARGRAGSIARYAGVAAALVLVTAGYRVGSLGGDLVYEHGAAQAYVQPSTSETPSADDDTTHPPEGSERGDDENDEGGDHEL